MSARIIGREILMDAVSVSQAATAYSSVMNFERCTGTVAVNLISTAGSITVTQQCSFDYTDVNPSGAHWFDPVDAAGTATGTVATACTVTTGKYITYSPVMTKFIRYKVVEQNSAATVVTLKLIFQEER